MKAKRPGSCKIMHGFRTDPILPLTPTFFREVAASLGRRLLDDLALAVVRVRQLDATPRQLDRKKVKAFSELTIVMGGLGVSGGDIHEYAKRVIKSAKNSIQLYEVLSCLGVPGPQLKLEDGEVPLQTVTSGEHRDMNNDVGPDPDTVVGETLLVLLLNDSVTWHRGPREPRMQCRQQLALITSLRLEEASPPHASETLHNHWYHFRRSPYFP